MNSTLKKCLLLSFGSFLFVSAEALGQSDLTGAWEFKEGDKRSVALFQDGYFTGSIFSADKYIVSFGGPYTIANNKLTVDVEFNSGDSEEVGKQFIADISTQSNAFDVVIKDKKASFTRIDNGKAPLAGVWNITDRMQDGKVVPILRQGTRKTLKILTGTRFQWFAIDPAKKFFGGTGGGTYTFTDGKYTENIEFFSRDDSRVGASLSFDGKLEDGKWHHSGLSSKGDKIYEIWGKVN